MRLPAAASLGLLAVLLVASMAMGWRTLIVLVALLGLLLGVVGGWRQLAKRGWRLKTLSLVTWLTSAYYVAGDIWLGPWAPSRQGVQLASETVLRLWLFFALTQAAQALTPAEDYRVLLQRLATRLPNRLGQALGTGLNRLALTLGCLEEAQARSSGQAPWRTRLADLVNWCKEADAPRARR